MKTKTESIFAVRIATNGVMQILVPQPHVRLFKEAFPDALAVDCCFVSDDPIAAVKAQIEAHTKAEPVTKNEPSCEAEMLGDEE